MDPPGFKFKNGTTPCNTNRFSPGSSSISSVKPMANQVSTTSDQIDDSSDPVTNVSSLSSKLVLTTNCYAQQSIDFNSSSQ